MSICFSLWYWCLYTQFDTQKFDAELERQDNYLNHYNMKRVAVRPDENCLFAAVWKAGKIAMDIGDLRRETAEYTAGNMNDFYKFMSVKPGGTLLDNMPSISEELQMMKKDGYWVGYESIMALSRHLGAVILVTSGGTTDNDAVRTDSFYFGEERPEKRIHIVWVSAGFYDAAVPTTGVAGSQVFGHRSAVEDNLLPQNGRHPSHKCQCKWACDCKRWVDVYVFPRDRVEPSSQAKAAHVNSSSASSLPMKSTNPSSSSPESYWDSNEVFSLTRFNKICHPSQRPRWQVDKEAIGLSRVQQCSSTYSPPS